MELKTEADGGKGRILPKTTYKTHRQPAQGMALSVFLSVPLFVCSTRNFCSPSTLYLTRISTLRTALPSIRLFWIWNTRNSVNAVRKSRSVILLAHLVSFSSCCLLLLSKGSRYSGGQSVNLMVGIKGLHSHTWWLAIGPTRRLEKKKSIIKQDKQESIKMHCSLSTHFLPVLGSITLPFYTFHLHLLLRTGKIGGGAYKPTIHFQSPTLWLSLVSRVCVCL